MPAFSHPTGVLKRRVILPTIEVEGWDDFGDENHVKAVWEQPKIDRDCREKCGADYPGFRRAVQDRELGGPPEFPLFFWRVFLEETQKRLPVPMEAS